MEASTVLDIYLQLAAEGIGIEHIISINDSTMRAHSSHIGTYKHGKLLVHIKQTVFLCDSSHQIKAMVNNVFFPALSIKENSECGKINTLQLKKYLGCYVGKKKNYLSSNLQTKRRH